MAHPWLRKLKNRRPARPFRPRLELLEDRLTPTTFTVSDLADSGAGSLRQAILDSNSTGGTNTVVFAPSVIGTIDLATALPDLQGNLDVQGPGANQLVVHRSSNSGTPSFSVFSVASGATVGIAGLTITNGIASDGGGINNLGTLTVKACSIQANTAAGSGGGINNGSVSGTGTLTVINSTVSANNGGTSGAGGIHNDGGVVTITNSTITFNGSNSGTAGGIANLGGIMTIQNSTVTQNNAGVSSQAGGGIDSSGSTFVFDTIVAGNTGGNDSDLSGGFNSDGHNLIGNITSSFSGTQASGFTDGINGDQVGNASSPIDPKVGPLQNNGGPTPTQDLLAGSPAVDAGDNANPPATDQRGFTRIVNGVIDIGAVEHQVSPTTVTLTSASNPSGFGQAATFRAQVNGASGGTPTGVVTFFDGVTALGSAPLSNGSAVFTTTGLGVGAHAITAGYGGDFNFSPNTAAPLIQTVARFWTGAGGDNHWTTPANWSGNAVPNSGDDLLFASGPLASVNDFFPGMSFRSITFQSMSLQTSGFALSGNAITLTGGISDLSSTGNSIGFDIALAGTPTVTVTNPSTVLTLGGVLTGSGGGFHKTGPGTLVLSGANQYGGPTDVTAGTVRVGAPGGVPATSAVTLASAAVLDLASDATIGSLAGLGRVALNGHVLTTGADNTATTFAGTINSVFDPGGLTKVGTGTWTLAGPIVNVGPATINGGIVSVLNGPNVDITAANVTVAAGATLQLQGGLTVDRIPLTLNGNGAGGRGALESVSGNNTWTGSVTLATDSTIAVDAGTLVLASGISGTGSLTRTGAGTLALPTTSTYSGATTVVGGTLVVDNLPPASPVVVQQGGKLSGNGTVGSITLVNGILSPGNSPGVLTSTGNLTLDAQSEVDVDAYLPTPGTGHDQVQVNQGTVNLGGSKLNLLTNSPTTAPMGTNFTIIQHQTTSAILGTFGGLPEGSAVSRADGVVFQITYAGGAGNDVVLTRGVRVQVTLTSSAGNFATAGQALTLTAAVTSTAPNTGAGPTGSVTFLDGTTTLGTAPLDGTGRATLAMTLPVGSHALSAAYGSDATFLPGSSPAVTQTVVSPSGDDTSFVRGLYQDLLGRAADPAGLNFFLGPVSAAQAGQLNNVVATFLSSAENRANFIRRDYTALLGRPASADDVTFWTGVLQQGVSDERVRATILGSPEYGQRHAGNDPDPDLAWLKAVYPDVLGRALDSAGQAFFLPQLQGGTPRSTVALTVLGSTEYRNQLVGGYYTTFLQRPAGPNDLAFWVSQFQQGQTDEQVAGQIAGSAEGFQKAGNNNIQWVQSLYRNVLQREPDAGGLNFFVNTLLLNYSGVRRTVVGVVAASAEYQARQVRNDYTTFLGRAASDGDVSFWVGVRQQGVTEEQEVALIVASAEYFQRAGATNAAWLDRLYQDLLGRARDAGSQFFLDALAAGATREQVASAILGTAEYRNRQASGFFSAFLGRTPVDAELAFFGGALQAGARDEDVLGLLLSTAEYYLRPHTS